jgi:ketosteroid isomerase-like protein
MPEESTTPDLVELAQRLEDAMRAGDDLDVVMSFYAPDAVWDLSSAGLGTFEGQAAIRGLYEDWRSSYEAFEAEWEELRDLGHGVTFSVVVNRGRPHGSAHWIELRYAAVQIWAGGLIERDMDYTDIDEARAAAERLAEEGAYASD